MAFRAHRTSGALVLARSVPGVVDHTDDLVSSRRDPIDRRAEALGDRLAVLKEFRHERSIDDRLYGRGR